MQILLVDDHTLFREALLHVLKQLDNNVLVREAANCSEARQILQLQRNLDLVLLDIDLPGEDGLTALPGLREQAPTLPIVVLSGSENAQHVQCALDRGAVGYIPKSCSGHEMVNALQLVLQGELFIPPRFLGKLSDVNAETEINPPAMDSHGLHGLTARQIEVLGLMAQGLPNKLIARKLNLAEGTVKLHVAAILRALNALNRTQAVTAAARIGLIQTS